MRNVCLHLRRLRVAAVAVVGVFAVSAVLSAQQPQTPSAIFRASRDVVSIDVVVRDRSGAIVRDLSADDFDIREDGRPQEVLTASFQEVDGTAGPAAETSLLQPLASRPLPTTRTAAPPEANGRRMLLLLFDLSAMEPEEVERGVQAGLRYVDTEMSNADIVAIASLTWELRVLTDFTGDRAVLRDVLRGLAAVDVSTGNGPETGGEVVAGAGGPGPAGTAAQSRLRALRLIADALAPVPQKKALLYFTAGLGSGAQDTPAELRAATTAATRANLAIYTVDTRGLQAIVPSGSARVASREGEGLFSGRDVNDQFNELTTSQDTMVAVASATGGRMFSAINDVSGAFTRVQRDTAAYYLLGYSSTNAARDGRFRRVTVRVRRTGLRIDARSGYYANADFAHTNRTDREAQLEEHLAVPSEPSAFEVQASAAWFRLAETDRFRVPVTVTVQMPPSGPGAVVKLDILAMVEDEQGRILARVRDTVDASGPSGPSSAALAYLTGVELPAGHFVLKVVVRENAGGSVGTTRLDIHLPDLTGESLAVSSPELRLAPSGTSPSLYVEVYNALAPPGAGRSLVVSAALFRDSVRVFEAELPRAARQPGSATTVAAYELPLSAGTLDRGRYRCQITVADPVSGRFAFIRTDLVIR